MKYTGNALNEISFPLGGIGTGSIGLAGNGRLVDWEIFNRPNKGSVNGYSHIAVKAKNSRGSVCRVLNSDDNKNLTGQYGMSYGVGPASCEMRGFPHFRKCEFTGEFPIANLKFTEGGFPGDVSLTAFNPLIPLDSDASSIPAAFFEIRFTNTNSEPTVYEVAFSLANPFQNSINRECDGFAGVKLTRVDVTPDSAEYGDLCLGCDDENAVVQPNWYRNNRAMGWQDDIVTFWNEFTSDEPLRHRTYDEPFNLAWRNDHCSIVAGAELAPNETKAFRFVVSWNIPNFENYWSPDDRKGKTWKNYYAKLFANSTVSNRYALDHFDDLYARTLVYHDELFASTLPAELLDAVSSNISVLKSATVSRLENGEFYGFEGCNEKTGSCEGLCQHVYNYAYALCFLFPDLERSIRNLEFDHATLPDGGTIFRLPLPLCEADKKYLYISCLDGQMGCVIKTYREWKISGDTDWLRRHWQTVKKVLEYAWSPENPNAWDLDKDGVLEGRQHHTLDMELFGPSSWLEGFYLAALRAAAEMAEFLGEPDKAKEYLDLFERGRKWTKENLFNGKYFIQKIDLTDPSVLERFGVGDVYWNDETGEIKYQIANGCEIDQLLGQWHADILGLGELFDRDQVEIALNSLAENNYKPTMREFTNPWRNFIVNDEAGTVMCDYPTDVAKPKIPITYCEETMHGFEYALAGLMLSRGHDADALRGIKAVRDRYAGFNRNPYNEIECGSNYIRSMASFAFLPILSGFVFDLPHEKIGFRPKHGGDFRCLWSLGTGWGHYERKSNITEIILQSGSLKLSTLFLPDVNPKSVEIDGKPVEFNAENGAITFASTLVKKSIVVK